MQPTKMPVMLAMLDVLGFSSRLESSGLDSVFSLYQALIDRVIIKEPMHCVGSHPVGDGSRCPALFSADIRYTYFSDTIMLWMPLYPLFAGPFIQRCSDMICEALLLGVGLRGSIALGDAVMHKPSGMFIGSPIVEAYRLERAQDWIGVAFAPSGTWNSFIAELNPTQLIEYDIPMKPGSEHLRSPLVLDWPRRWRDTQSAQVHDILKAMNTSPSYIKYYENTIAFTKYSERWHDWHMKTTTDDNLPFKYLHMTQRKGG